MDFYVDVLGRAYVQNNEKKFTSELKPRSPVTSQALTHCLLCGSPEIQGVSRSDWLECGSCTLVFPPSAPLSGVVTNQIPRAPKKSGTLLTQSQARLAMRVIGSRSLVDFGCGNGAFLMTFKNRDSAMRSTLGVELDQQSRNAAIGAGLVVATEYESSIQNVLVTFWHSAEHLSISDFRTILINMHHPSNRLIISVPNGSSLAWSLHKENFAFFDSESHMVQYNYRSLTQLLDECGWTTTKKYRMPLYGIFCAIQTAINLSRPRNELYAFLKRGARRPSVLNLGLNMFALFRAAPELFRLLGAEFTNTRAACLTIEASPRQLP